VFTVQPEGFAHAYSRPVFHSPEGAGYVPALRPADWVAVRRLLLAAPVLLAALEAMTADLLQHAQLGLNEQELLLLHNAQVALNAAKGENNGERS
jgi:hypothetical protein